MKLMEATGGELLAARLDVANDLVFAHTSFGGGAMDLDLPKLTVSFESTRSGLLVHVGLAGTDKKWDVLVEYDDVKALKQIPGKGLVSFALKAFR